MPTRKWKTTRSNFLYNGRMTDWGFTSPFSLTATERSVPLWRKRQPMNNSEQPSSSERRCTTAFQSLSLMNSSHLKFHISIYVLNSFEIRLPQVRWRLYRSSTHVTMTCVCKFTALHSFLAEPTYNNSVFSQYFINTPPVLTDENKEENAKRSSYPPYYKEKPTDFYLFSLP